MAHYVPVRKILLERGKKSMRKHLLSGITVVLISAALCACGGGKKNETTAASAAQAAPAAAETTAVSAAAETKAPETAETGSNSLSAETPVAGGRVVFGITQDLNSLDPHIDTDAGTRDVVFNLYEGLVKPTPTGDMMPAVASSYEISEDAKVYTFTLRDGIKFHDGTAVTVEDVKYSLDRYAELYKGTSAFSIVESVETPDDKTVVVTLTESNSEFLPNMVVAVIPKSNVDPAGKPIGTGPFKYVNYVPGEKLVVEKFADYWQEGLPHLDEVEFKIVPDVETEFVDLQAGTIDIMKYMTEAQIQALGSNSDYNIVESSMNLVQGMFLSNTYEPLANTKVRQALCYAVNRDEINQFIFGGKSKPAGTHMIHAMGSYYEPATESVYTYDPSKAKELLAEAGYPDGFDLVITVPSSFSQHVDTAQIIVEQLKAVGVNASIQQVEWATWLSDTYRGGNFQATVIGFDGTMTPSDWLKRYTSTASNNFCHYSNEEFDKLFAQAYAEIDMDKKASLYKQCEMILAEDAAAVYIQDPVDLVAVNKKFAGYTSYPTAAEDMSLIYAVN